MNYNSVIKPDAMISQCNEMLLMFEQDNDSIQTVWNAFHQFIEDSEIESEAYRQTIKMVLRMSEEIL